MIEKFIIRLKNYNIVIFNNHNKNNICININDKNYDINMNIFNFFASSILNANNEIIYLKKRNIEYSGKIYENLYKNHKVFIEKYDLIKIFIDNEIYIINSDEISTLSEEIYKFYENKYKFNFSLRDIDTMYLAFFFWKRLNYIIKANIEYVMIDDLYVKHQGKESKIIDTAYFKVLNKNKKINIPTVFNTNHIKVSNYKRIHDVIYMIKKYKYPYNNQYIIVYNNEFEIRDGQHRAASLRYLYGNIKIPIMRIYFNLEKFNKFYKN